MNIGLESTHIVKGDISGIPVYHYNLIKNLIKIELNNHFTLFYQSFLEPKNIDALKLLRTENVKLFKIAIPEPIIKATWRIFKFPPLDIFYSKLDIFHYSYYALMPIHNRKIKKIITIHDVTPLLLPEAHKLLTIDFFSRLIRFARNEADLIIAVSFATKNDLINYCKIPEKKIRVIYESTPENLINIDYTQRDTILVREKYHIGCGPYILYVGSLEPRKNLVRAIKAFSILKENSKFKDYKFLFVSGTRWKDKDLFNCVERLHIKSDLIFCGYVNDTVDLGLLYKNAELFIYPSLYEGFGLPPLEAMSLGVPVITSNVSSLPEVVGDAAIKINPYSVEEIYDAMRTVLSDSGLRAELSQKGIERAKMFSWEKVARETLAVYEEAMRL